MPYWKNSLRKKETDYAMTMAQKAIKKAALKRAAFTSIFKNYSTITIPFAVTLTSFSGLVIAAISSFDFLASSA